MSQKKKLTPKGIFKQKLNQFLQPLLVHDIRNSSFILKFLAFITSVLYTINV